MIESIIAAMDEKRGVGRNNDLLFKIPEDFKRMQTLTNGHPIVMGRKTFESIGRVLPNRTNIIVTRDPNYAVEGAIVVHSLDEGIKVAREKEENMQGQGADDKEEIFIFGGGQIWKEALEKGIVNRMYLTVVKGDYHADTYFPEYSGFKVIKEEKKEADGFEYTFLDLEK